MDDPEKYEPGKVAETQALITTDVFRTKQVENKEKGGDIQSKQIRKKDSSYLDEPFQHVSETSPAGIVGEKKAMFSVKNEDMEDNLHSKQQSKQQFKQMKNEEKNDHLHPSKEGSQVGSAETDEE